MPSRVLASIRILGSKSLIGNKIKTVLRILGDGNSE